MRDAGKLRRRDRDRDRPVIEAAPAPAPEAPPAAPAEADATTVGTLLGTSPIARINRWRQARRSVRWGALSLLVLGLGSPFFFWGRYASQNVTSTNAAVRGRLAEIGTRVSGVVTKIEVDVGDHVVAGQVLARMDSRHILAEVQEARADVEGLRRTIEVEGLNIALEHRRTAQAEEEAAAKVAEANAQTDAARIRAEQARRDQELRQTLFSRDGVVSGEDVHAAETRRLTADAQLTEARANAAAARSAGRAARLGGDAVGIQERKLGVLEADLRRAQARLTRAEADLDGALIRAPEDGAIVQRVAQAGASVQTGQPILSMWLGRDVWVEAWIDEDDIGAVRLGSKATVRLHSFPGREFTGVVDKLGLATDFELPSTAVPQPRSTRMRGAPVVGVRIRLDEPPPELLPGLSAVVAIRKAG
jgi:membrane fusion protein (multidrug efflux system)